MFLDLSLSIPEPPTTLVKCIEAFTAPEIMIEKDQYYCGKCQGLQNATKQMFLELIPPVIRH